MPPTKYSDDDRHTALQVWAIRAKRRPSVTSRLLAADHGIHVEASTIAQWARRHDWHNRAADLFRDIAPGMLEEIGFNLLSAAHAGSSYVVDVFEGREEADRDKLRAAYDAIDRIHPTAWSARRERGANLAARIGHASSADTDTGDDMHALDLDTLRQLASGARDADAQPDRQG